MSEIDEEIIELDESVKGINSSLQDINGKINGINNSVDTINNTISGLDTEVKGNSTQINDINTQISGIANEIATVESTLNEQIEAINNKQDKLNFTPEDAAKKNQPNGYAPLDENKKVPSDNIPDEYVTDQQLADALSNFDGGVTPPFTDSDIGTRTIDQTIASTPSNTAFLTELLSYLAKSLVSATGQTNWYDASPIALTAMFPKSKMMIVQGLSFNSATGVIVPHNIGHTNYVVFPVVTSNPVGYLGEVWVEKASNNFGVYCSGSTTSTTFDVILFINE